MPLDFGDLSAHPYSIQQAFEAVRREFDRVTGDLNAALEIVQSLPPILSIEEIQDALAPTGTNPLPTAGLLNTTPADTGGGPIPPVDDGIPNYLGIVTSVHASFGIGPTTSDEQMFRFMQTVAEQINASGMNPLGITCGYTDAPPAGSNVFTCAGNTYRYNRVSFSNDHTFKIVEDSDPGGSRGPSWDDNGLTPGLYEVATGPGSSC